MEYYAADTRPTVLLIDGAHALRRSMYVESLRELSTSGGVPTGAVYGFLNIIKSAITSMNASSLIICWEGGHSQRRQEIYDHYKYREPKEVEERDSNGYTDYEYYCHQLSWIKKILECLGVHQLQVQGKEGDDVIYQAAKLLKGRKIIISEDSDFYSLISDDVSQYRPIKKIYVDLNNFQEISGYATPIHYMYSKALLGDGSDNIPSVAKGVGAKTISTILENIEEPSEVNPKRIIQEATRIGTSRYMKLVNAGEQSIIRNLDLVDISREKFDIFQLKSLSEELSSQKYPNVQLATKLMKALEFNMSNISSTISRITTMSEYSLVHMIDNDYMKNFLMGVD